MKKDKAFIKSNHVPSEIQIAQHQFNSKTVYLVKVKVNRGEPANEEADIQADKAISGKDVPTEWHDKTNRAVFTMTHGKSLTGKEVR